MITSSRCLTAIGLLLCLASPVWAEPTDDSLAVFVRGAQAYHSEDYATTLKVLRPLAEDESFRGVLWLSQMAKFYVGLMYRDGKGAPRDYREAVKWFRRAAEQGLSRAQTALAEMYRDGMGVGQNYALAIQLFRKAAEEGESGAQSGLGEMYRKGKGVPQDYAEAVLWFRLAAEQGEADAQINLGTLYNLGEGVPQDYAEALRWFRLAAWTSPGLVDTFRD